jgi:flagellar motility protein MotE (MotC chaperone)
VLALWVVPALLSSPQAPIGAAFADTASQQKDLANPAAGSAVAAPSSGEGKEAKSGNIDQEPVDREYVQALQAREQAVAAREREVGRREEVLKDLQRDIDEKLQRLEKARTDLQAMTQQIDESRAKEIKDAVKRFKAMDETTAAKILIQMDLADALTVLKNLDGTTVGGIFTAMMEAAETGDPNVTGSVQAKKEKLARMKDLWEHMIDPDKALTTPTPQPAAVPTPSAGR